MITIPQQSILHLVLRKAKRCNSITRASRHFSVNSTKGETEKELDSLTRPEVEGPVEVAMSGEARICVIARLFILKEDVALCDKMATAIEAEEVSEAVEAQSTAIKTVVTSRAVRVEPLQVHVSPYNKHMS